MLKLKTSAFIVIYRAVTDYTKVTGLPRYRPCYKKSCLLLIEPAIPVKSLTTEWPAVFIHLRFQATGTYAWNMNQLCAVHTQHVYMRHPSQDKRFYTHCVTVSPTVLINHKYMNYTNVCIWAFLNVFSAQFYLKLKSCVCFTSYAGICLIQKQIHLFPAIQNKVLYLMM